jgi:Trk K+ transport system NAD-binding subunit
MDRQPVILCGLGQVGQRILEYLHAAGAPVVAIDLAPPDWVTRLDRVKVIRGDFRQRDILLQAGLDQARGVLIVTSDDLINISTALMVRHLHPSIRVVVRLFNQNLIQRLGQAVKNMFALSVSSLSAPLLALTALTGQALGTFNLDGGRYQVAELTIQEHSAVAGRSVADVAARYGALPLAHISAGGGKRFLLDVDGEAHLAIGDQLILCGDPRHLALLLEGVADETLPHLRWAGWFRRTGRVLWRAILEIDLSVKICTAVLLAVVCMSTIVYCLGMRKSLPDSMYRTISVIATAADMHERELQEGWQKVFVGILRLFGAALIGAFTAIVTSYLLRARLRGAFEVRRIPDSGHVIVCGLGNVGFRLVEELSQYDERIVIIEPNRDGRFMAAARRKRNVAMIVGDATVLEVLRQAHAASARAVVAATSHDLANLEIALLARELNPRQRVVVRMSDPLLSETLREAANVRLAMALPTLAAPAFVAALFGDRVLSVFLIKGRFLAVIELLISPEDRFLNGQIVRALAIDYGLLPVKLITADGTPSQQPMDRRLVPGDRLTVIAALPDLQRLLRRERVPSDCGVDVTGFTLLARPLVLQLLRERRGLTPEAAESALDQLPIAIGSGLTRGQAEDLLAMLRHEGVKAQVQQAELKLPDAVQ